MEEIDKLNAKINELRDKINEVITCLDSNEITHKIPINFINTEIEEVKED